MMGDIDMGLLFYFLEGELVVPTVVVLLLLLGAD
jgi:hypothetical protein